MWQPTLQQSLLNFCTKHIMAVLWSLTCAAVILSLLQENNLSNSIPYRVKCRTKAINHLSQSLETWKMLKIILSKIKFINYQNQWYHTKLCFNVNLAMWNLRSDMKSSSHKTWQTSLLFLKPLQIQNLKRKSGEAWHIISAPPEKVGATRPPCPSQNCAHVHRYCESFLR